MNTVSLIGRLTKTPSVRTSQNGTKIARYSLAVDRRFKRDGEPTADFIPCVVFGKGAEFAENYLDKGIKIAVIGRIQTGHYDKDDGTRVYTTDVIVDSQEFCESKKTSEEDRPEAPDPGDDDFLDIPEDEMSELPFA